MSGFDEIKLLPLIECDTEEDLDNAELYSFKGDLCIMGQRNFYFSDNPE